MIDVSRLVHAGARRLVDGRTYLIVLAGIVLGGVLPMLLWGLLPAEPDVTAGLLVLFMGIAWTMAVQTYCTGMLYLTAGPHRRRELSALLRAATALFPTFLCGALLVAA